MGAPQSLAGKRVIELSQFIAAPTAAQLLADFGAEVVKVEPEGGDGSRHLPGTRFGSGYYRSFNTSKRSIVLNMRAPDGQARLHELLAGADALVCNIQPATLRRLGLDTGSLKAKYPDLIVTLISGYGQEDNRSCVDTIAQCESGFAWLDGAPRVSTSWPVDFYSGMHAAMAMATAMALLDPGRTGGTVVDISMMEVAAAMLLGPAALLASEGMAPAPPTGNRDRASAPSRIYRCADGHAYIYGGLDPYWAKLRPLLGGEDAPLAERMARADEFDAVVEAWTHTRSRDEVLAKMAEIGVPAGAVRHPAEAIDIIRAAAGRADAVTAALPTGEHVPSFPALFDGERPIRRPAPALDGGE